MGRPSAVRRARGKLTRARRRNGGRSVDATRFSFHRRANRRRRVTPRAREPPNPSQSPRATVSPLSSSSPRRWLVRHRAALAASSRSAAKLPPARRSRRNPPPPADPRSTPASSSLPRSRSSARVEWRRPLPAWWRRRHLVSIRISASSPRTTSASAARVLRSSRSAERLRAVVRPRVVIVPVRHGVHLGRRQRQDASDAMRVEGKAPRASRRRVFVVPVSVVDERGERDERRGRLRLVDVGGVPSTFRRDVRRFERSPRHRPIFARCWSLRAFAPSSPRSRSGASETSAA